MPNATASAFPALIKPLALPEKVIELEAVSAKSDVHGMLLAVVPEVLPASSYPGSVNDTLRMMSADATTAIKTLTHTAHKMLHLCFIHVYPSLTPDCRPAKTTRPSISSQHGKLPTSQH
jgi:hypothetical protein